MRKQFSTETRRARVAGLFYFWLVLAALTAGFVCGYVFAALGW